MGKSNIAGDINVYSDYLMLEPQVTYSLGQQVSLKVTVLNQQNPKLETSIALTVTGLAGYSFYDFLPHKCLSQNGKRVQFHLGGSQRRVHIYGRDQFGSGTVNDL